MRAFISKISVAVVMACAVAPSAMAQDYSMKVCGERWQAAKAAGATNGSTWTKFLTDCRATLATATPVAASTPAAPSVVAKPASAPAAASASKEAKPAAAPVFPTAVPAKFAELRASQGRQKTCSEQYQANKATGGNAGLRWLEKGGGYWSLCNKKLKGV